MFNVGGGELLVILLVALIVLGPNRLPGAVRQVGQVVGELRKISSGFQTDLKSALEQAERDAEREVAEEWGSPDAQDAAAPDATVAPMPEPADADPTQVVGDPILLPEQTSPDPIVPGIEFAGTVPVADAPPADDPTDD